jgi:tight adherence protein B
MLILALFCVSVVIAIAAWLIQRWGRHAFHRYEAAFQKEAKARLSEFFLFLDPAQLWLANLIACAGLMGIVYFAAGSAWLMAVIGIVALIAPQSVIALMRRRRQARFDEQLPDLLLALAGALRAGSGVQPALRYIVMQMPAPLGQEFGLMLREQRMGLPFEQSLAELYRRMPSEGTGLVVSSLNIAIQSGGNLAETLERIASTLRARSHLIGRVQALTSQGRLQAWVMASLPFFLALTLDQLDPDSMALLWHSQIGWAVIAVIVVLELIGVMFIRRIVNIDV